MSTLASMLRRTTDLGTAQSEWLHLLVGDWQLVADLSVADLVLWVPEDEDWRAVAHVRPNTGPMVFYDDIVGRTASKHRTGLLQAAASARLTRHALPVVAAPGDSTIREDAVPVVHDGETLAVLSRHTNLASGRTPSRLELTYRQLSDAILRMVATGHFPSASAPTGSRRGAPRVGDGVIRLDIDGRVLYASPNAVSAVHRMGFAGELVGEILAKVVTDVAMGGGRMIDESLAVVVMGRAAWPAEVETAGATVTMRAIPIIEGGTRVGAMLLLRDVSELRRREQELLSKDATIREIHHRVKNNLQTVAALLRLQARRLPEDAARTALEEAGRRVATIAMVHETLSAGFTETVDFDEIAVRGLRAVVEVARQEHPVESTFLGSFGQVRAEDATPLAMVLSELIQNAVEHGLAGRSGSVVVSAGRRAGDDDHGDELTVTVTDDGIGLPTGFRPGLAGLGTRIVTSFVQDLRGRIRWENVTPHGTKVEFVARLRPLAR